MFYDLIHIYCLTSSKEASLKAVKLSQSKMRYPNLWGSPVTLAHLSSAYSLSLQERKSSFPSIFINGCQGYVSGGLLRDTFFQIKFLFI